MSEPADLTMPHLREAPPPAAAPKAAPPPDAREQREWTFPFEYRTKRGRVYSGEFTNRVLDIGQKMQHGLMRAKRSAGMTADQLSPMVVELIFMVTWLDLSLVSRPEWARDLGSLTEEALVQAIFAKVADHEQCFRGEGPAAAGGAD